MSKKLSREDVIEKIKILTGDLYDFSKFEYKKMIIKSCFICKIHGEFWMRPNDILFGHGCPPCAHARRNYIKNNNEKNIIDENGKSNYEKRYEKIHLKRNTNDLSKMRIETIKRMKNEIGEDGLSKFDIRVNKWLSNMIEKGHFTDPTKNKTFKSYRNRVSALTRKTLKNNNIIINYLTHEIDHKYSVKEGFNNNVSIEIICHISNLEILPITENRKKQSKCSITLEELLTSIDNFNNFL